MKQPTNQPHQRKHINDKVKTQKEIASACESRDNEFFKSL